MYRLVQKSCFEYTQRMISRDTKSKMRFLAGIVILLIGLTGLSACSGSDPLYGKWEEPNSGVMLEIKNNGQMITTVNGTTVTMQYSLEVPDVLILDGSKDGSVPEQRLTYAATDDQLTLTVDGVSTVFERVK